MRRGRVISLLVAVGVVMSCIFDTPYEGACSDLNITLEFPASMATKSDVGQVPASDAENAVTDLTLWVFRSNDHEFVCSLRLPEEDSEAGFPQSGTVRRYTLPVPSSFALERPKIDVYVLVNAASVGKQELRNPVTHTNKPKTELRQWWTILQDSATAMRLNSVLSILTKILAIMYPLRLPITEL